MGTCCDVTTRRVEDAAVELEADDGEDDDCEQDEQADLQQRSHGAQDGLEDDLQTCNDRKKRQSYERNYRNS